MTSPVSFPVSGRETVIAVGRSRLVYIHQEDTYVPPSVIAMTLMDWPLIIDSTFIIQCSNLLTIQTFRRKWLQHSVWDSL